MNPTEYLDQLDQARAAATPGEWEHLPGEGIWWGESETSDYGTFVAQDVVDADAALIVAAVNALPKLTVALRGCLRWADQLDREALALGAMPHDLHKAEAAQKRDAAAGIRFAITTALGGAL